MGLENIGKVLLLGGAILAASGLIILLAGKAGFVGKLPGDIIIQRGNFTFYFPLVTFILVSLILTIVLNLLLRFLR